MKKSHLVTMLVLCLLSLFEISYVVYKKIYLSDDFQRSVFLLNKQKTNKLENFDNDKIIQTGSSKKERPIVSILLVGTDADKYIDQLPAEVNFGMDIDDINNKQIENKRIFINIPIQEEDAVFNEVNKSDLLVDLPLEENSKRLNLLLEKSKKYGGVFTNVEDKFSLYEKNAEMLIDNLKKSNLTYLCGLTDNSSLLYQYAKKMSFPIIPNSVILDSEIFVDAINEKISQLESTAIKEGMAVAIGGNYPLTVELLKRWFDKLESKGIRLVSLEEFYNIYQHSNEKDLKRLSVNDRIGK